MTLAVRLGAAMHPTPEQKRLRFSRLRAVLDTGANVAAMAAAVAIVWSIVFRDQPGPIRPLATAPPERSLPTVPVSLQGAWTEGSSGAKVVIIEYSDFQCPFCARFAQDALPEIRKRYVASGKVRLAFRHLPMSDLHPLAHKAAEASECAGRQGQFWPMHDALFARPTRLDEVGLKAAADRLGLDKLRFLSCLDGETVGKVRSDAASAAMLQITATPTFLIGVARDDGRVDVVTRVSGARPIETFVAALDPLIARP